MRLYYTLAQPLFPRDKGLNKYFDEQGIKYRAGADRHVDLAPYGYIINDADTLTIVSTYVALLDKADLSAIKLSISEVQIIRNRANIDRLNRIRKWFRWILN